MPGDSLESPEDDEYLQPVIATSTEPPSSTQSPTSTEPIKVQARPTEVSGWQDPLKSVQSRTSALLENEYLSDVTFRLWPANNGSGGEQPLAVPAHKLILSISSSVFADLFAGQTPPASEVNLTDVQPEAFRAVLR